MAVAVTLPFVVAYVMAVAVAAVDASVSVAGLVAVNFCCAVGGRWGGDFHGCRCGLRPGIPEEQLSGRSYGLGKGPLAAAIT